MSEPLDGYLPLGNAYMFLGASLLKPISQTSRMGFVPDYWQAARELFDSPAVEESSNALAAFASWALLDEDKAVKEISVEWTRLFVGPPKPAAAPWESFYRADNVKSGFGPSAFEMQKLLRDYDLEVSGDNNQYADHIGIELLFLGELCRRAKTDADVDKACAYAREHPYGWIAALEEAVAASAPDGYYRLIIAQAKALLEMQLAA